MNKESLEKLNMALIELIVGAGLPFSLVEDAHFKKFVAALNEPYSKKLPSRRTLSESHLDKLYEKVQAQTKKIVPNNVCLLADSWKNKAGKKINFSVLIHNANGAPVFVNSFDFSFLSETAENLSLCVSFPFHTLEMSNYMFCSFLAC